ncbi:hypothetical protein [Agromyces protaetiae]|uniref:hypothetical protein n=1 Tax=Agromyces protaetiae TaxID=2509455 RepID=UPI001AA05E97|nr:hypothetical protein [Agromyces protaetiae]
MSRRAHHQAARRARPRVVVRSGQPLHAGDDEGATIERWREAPGGGVDGEVERERSSWRDLQEHAAFPETTTTVTGAELSLPIGKVECLRFETRFGPEADAPVARFWFARAHAGMPVRYELPAEGGGVDATTMIGDEVVAG